jgi:hypothetical protein
MAEISLVTVNWHSAGWIGRLLDNLHRKSSGRNVLRGLILDNTNGTDMDLTNIGAASLPCTVQPIDCRGLIGSRAHALALHEAMGMVQSEYILIVDPDIHVFAAEWDTLCIDALSAKNAWAVGAPYPRWKVGKYHDFPSPVFCLFRREITHQVRMDWRPYDDCPWCNAGVFLIRQIGRLGGLLSRRLYESSAAVREYAKANERLFGTFSQDTGWRIAREMRRRKIISIGFDDVMPGEVCRLNIAADPVWTDLAREFELFAFSNRPMLVHRYGSGARPWRTEKGSDESFWLQCIDRAEAILSADNGKPGAGT